MNYLLDVNALVAWAWTDHPHHLRVDNWIAEKLRNKNTTFSTTAIVELGFVRISVLRSPLSVTIPIAAQSLTELLQFLKHRHVFLPDDLSSCRPFPTWCRNAKHTTDAHLLALATKHNLHLATLDTGIPGAFLIP